MAIVGWFLLWLGVFVSGTLYGIIADPGEEVWAKFWHVYIWILFVLALITTIWFTCGGLRDMLYLFRSLKTQKRDYDDDGTVRHEATDQIADERSVESQPDDHSVK